MISFAQSIQGKVDIKIDVFSRDIPRLAHKDIAFEFASWVSVEFKIYLIKEPESYYLGTKYLVLEVKQETNLLGKILKDMFFYGIVIFFIMVGFGYFLLKLMLKPMRDAIKLLDRFIKDTTHELNTPVNAIISNIEMIGKSKLESSLVKKIKRIDIGARTVSNLYQDLTYLVLGHQRISKDEWIDLKELILDRVDYFYKDLH